MCGRIVQKTGPMDYVETTFTNWPGFSTIQWARDTTRPPERVPGAVDMWMIATRPPGSLRSAHGQPLMYKRWTGCTFPRVCPQGMPTGFPDFTHIPTGPCP